MDKEISKSELKIKKEEALKKKELKKDKKEQLKNKQETEENGEASASNNPSGNNLDAKSTKAKKKVEVNIPDKEITGLKKDESNACGENVKPKPKKLIFSMTSYEDLMVNKI
jgi:hypothetical protein